MKRIKAVHIVLTLAALVGAIAYAAPDVDPWRKNYNPYQHEVPQAFNKEVNLAFVDAGQFATVKTSFLDAGQANVAGNARVGNNLTVVATGTIETLDAGAANFQGLVGMNRPVRVGAATFGGTCNLTSASPSTCTATVEAGSTCVCWPIGTTAAIAAGGCAANVSSTTATFTGPNTVTTTIRYMCFL